MGLFDFLKNIPTANEISGSFAERLTKAYSELTADGLVLRDVLIDGANGFTSQIDLIIVGNKGIYVIEVKNYADAKIYGNAQSSKWNYYKYGKKYEIYSPLFQNKKHIEYIKSFLLDFGEVPCYSIVTMICDDMKISGEINKDGTTDTIICSSLTAMKKAISMISENRPIVFDDAKKHEIFDYINNNQYIGKEARLVHKQNVIAYKKSLEEKNEQKICPYCKCELVLRNGKNGKFYGCKNFPKCRYTMNYEE